MTGSESVSYIVVWNEEGTVLLMSTEAAGLSLLHYNLTVGLQHEAETMRGIEFIHFVHYSAFCSFV